MRIITRVEKARIHSHFKPMFRPVQANPFIEHHLLICLRELGKSIYISTRKMYFRLRRVTTIWVSLSPNNHCTPPHLTISQPVSNTNYLVSSPNSQFVRFFHCFKTQINCKMNEGGKFWIKIYRPKQYHETS